MRNPTLIIAAVVLTSAAAHADPASVLRAGEWETRNDNGPVNHICHLEDHAFDRATLDWMMGAERAKCAPADVGMSGPVTTYATTCEVAGGRMTVHGTITAQGPDAFTTHIQSHFEGGTIKMPDMDMSQVARRTGPCRPGDRQGPD